MQLYSVRLIRWRFRVWVRLILTLSQSDIMPTLHFEMKSILKRYATLQSWNRRFFRDQPRTAVSFVHFIEPRSWSIYSKLRVIPAAWDRKMSASYAKIRRRWCSHNKIRLSFWDFHSPDYIRGVRRLVGAELRGVLLYIFNCPRYIWTIWTQDWSWAQNSTVYCRVYSVALPYGVRRH